MAKLNMSDVTGIAKLVNLTQNIYAIQTCISTRSSHRLFLFFYFRIKRKKQD
jgi:hypothetical protein